jgi:hypothetical protein
MLGLSGEHLWPYWGAVSVKVWEMPHGLGCPGHKVWLLPRGLGGTGHEVLVLPCGLGGPVARKRKGTRAPSGFGDGFGALGGRRGEQPSESQIDVLWIFGYMDK